MICEVNGEHKESQYISYREPGFGGSVELPLYPYVLRYGINEMCDLIAEDFNAFVHEMKLDFEQTGDAHPLYLHDLGYPPIDILVQHESEFCQIIRTFLYSELFNSSFPWSQPYQNVRWIINNIDSVYYCQGVVVVTGQVFRKVE